MLRYTNSMRGKAGFTLIELALTLTVLGLLLVPLLHVLGDAALRKREATTRAALENARDALLNYAFHHQGCLPDAADFEGAAIDTDRNFNGNSPDTGSVRLAVEPATGGSGQHAGDVPWADLALPALGLDGDHQRLQYYVASFATSPTQTRAGNDNSASRTACPTRLRQGIEVWRSATPYKQGDIVASNSQWYVAASDVLANNAPPASPWQSFGPVTTWQASNAYNKRSYVSYQGAIYRALVDNSAATPALSPDIWRQVGLPDGSNAPAWQSHASEGYRRGELVTYDTHTFRAMVTMTNAALAPSIGTVGPDWIDLTLPDRFLETRLGPIINTPPGSTVSAAQNIFVLLAAGHNKNDAIGHAFLRDSNHMLCSSPTICSAWTSLNDVNVDSATFSLTPPSDTSPDTILPVSFADYQAAMAKAGFNTQAVQY